MAESCLYPYYPEINLARSYEEVAFYTSDASKSGDPGSDFIAAKTLADSFLGLGGSSFG